MPLFLAMLRSETAADPGLRERALRGLTVYQRADREDRRFPGRIVGRAGRATIRDCGERGAPVVLIPSLINSPAILDLAPDRSLIGFLRDSGWRPLLVDWGNPGPDDASDDLAAHVTGLLVPVIDGIGEPAPLIGYCLGGTLALAAAALGCPAGVATIAAPWRFAGYGPATRRDMAMLWREAEPTARRLGLVPIELLQAAFWRLDPARTIAKYADLAERAPDGTTVRAFVRLEDWANGGAPLTYAAGRDLFEALLRDDLPGHGRWRIGGQRIDPAALCCPAIEFVSSIDRITPAATAIGLADRRVIERGHVGMMVGRGAREALWSPLAEWLGALSGKGHAPARRVPLATGQ